MKNWIKFQCRERKDVYVLDKVKYTFIYTNWNEVIYYYLLLSILIVRSVRTVKTIKERFFMHSWTHGTNEWCTCVSRLDIITHKFYSVKSIEENKITITTECTSLTLVALWSVDGVCMCVVLGRRVWRARINEMKTEEWKLKPHVSDWRSTIARYSIYHQFVKEKSLCLERKREITDNANTIWNESEIGQWRDIRSTGLI